MWTHNGFMCVGVTFAFASACTCLDVCACDHGFMRVCLYVGARVCEYVCLLMLENECMCVCACVYVFV